MLAQKKKMGAAGFALISGVLIVTAIVHFSTSIQPGDSFNRFVCWMHQWISLALCLGALVCSCVAVAKARLAKNYVAVFGILVLVGLCLLTVLLASIGVLGNGEILLFGGSER